MLKFDYINRLLKRRTNGVPNVKEVYACGTGTYVGEMLVYCKKDLDTYYFISIPKNINRVIPIDKFNFAIANKIIELAHVLPNDVFKICYKQHEYNRSNLNTNKKETK